MKAIIFNSGLGKRLGKFTENHHKSMIVLNNSETILQRQIRILGNCGITEFVITTGPFKEQIEKACEKFDKYKFNFVENPIYKETNYIYSLWLARDYLDDDFLMLHGDLVFNQELVQEMLEDKRGSICLINEDKRLPEKDFKGRIHDEKLKEVSIEIFDDDCYAFQPLYKLKKEDLLKWIDKVDEFVKEGNVKVYAENALNEILNDMNIYTKSYRNNYIDEIDNVDDYKRVSREIEEFEENKKKKMEIEDAKVYR